MAYIFMDESGDLGFSLNKKGTSNNFLITFLFCVNRRQVEKVIKKAYIKLSAKIRKTHTGCLHGTKENKATRQFVLKSLSATDIKILTISLNKLKVYTKLRNEKHVLYNYVTNILLDRLYTKKLIPVDQPIELIASQRETNRFLNDNFKTYLENQIKSNHKLDLTITISPSHGDKCLQAVDFACWAIFRKIEHNDKEYYDLIKPAIIEESKLFS